MAVFVPPYAQNALSRLLRPVRSRSARAAHRVRRGHPRARRAGVDRGAGVHRDAQRPPRARLTKARARRLAPRAHGVADPWRDRAASALSRHVSRPQCPRRRRSHRAVARRRTRSRCACRPCGAQARRAGHANSVSAPVRITAAIPTPVAAALRLGNDQVERGANRPRRGYTRTALRRRHSDTRMTPSASAATSASGPGFDESA